MERGAHNGTSLIAGLVTMQSAPEGLQHPMEKTHTRAVYEELRSPWEKHTLDKFAENYLPWESSHSGAGGECEESSP